MKSLEYIAIAALSVLFGVFASVSSTFYVSNKQIAAVAGATSGLVAYWSFDDGTGNDISGNGNNGTVSGATPTTGKMGGAMSFDGVDDAVVVPDSPSLSPSLGFTISFWINSGKTTVQRVIDKGYGSYLFRFGPNKMQVVYGGFFDSNGIVPANTWTYVTFTGDSSGYKWYVNGMLDKQNSTVWVKPTAPNTLYIGGTIDHFMGVLDEMRIYSRALSASEVLDLYAASGGTNGGTGSTTNPPSDVSTPQPLAPITEISSSGPDYYVDFEGGSDTNTGTQTSPWKHAPGDSNATANANKTLASGDHIFFKGGVKYRGAVTFSTPGVTYKGDAWPSGSKAIIDGSFPVTNWMRCASSDAVCAANANSANIYYADITVPSFLATEPALSLNAYQNDQPLVPAQYPNALNPLYPDLTNFLKITPSQLTQTSLTDSRLSALCSSLPGKWMYIWVNPNSTIHMKINSCSGSTITFPTTNVYTNRDSFFAIVNSPDSSVLDTPGEYYLNEIKNSDSTNRLYVWPLNNQNPIGSSAISIGAQKAGIVGYYPNNIIIEGFVFQYQTGDSYGEGNAIGGGGSTPTSGLIIRNNEIRAVRADGSALILTSGVSNVTVENNYLHDSADGSKGVQVMSASNGMVRNNTIRNIAGTAIYFPGMSNSSIMGNTITDGGGSHANGISVYQGSSNVTVAGNVVRNFNNAYTFENSSNVNTYNNIFDGNNNTGYVVANWGGMTGTNIFSNNVVMGSNNDCSVFFSDGGIIVKNNIIDGGGVSTGAHTNNIYTSLCWNQAANYGWGLGTDEMNVTNLSSIFVNAANGDYHLISNSSAIDRGISMSTLYSTDREGVTRPRGSAWDIGAYESPYSGGITPPVTSVLGDFNNDGVVNSIDLSLMSSAWNQNNATYDLNKDGTVNTLDYTIMVKNWTN